MFKRLINIVFPERIDEVSWDLFKLKKVRDFFYNRKNFTLIRTFGDVVFLFIIAYGLFGPQNKEENPIIFLTWGIWWPSVVLTWFFLGRMWCAFCPFPGVARLLQKLKLSFAKKPSPWFEKYGIHLATTFFFIIIWLETATPLTEVPRYTSFLILTVVFLAGFLGIFYQGYAWCRYLCPLGRITGVSASMALIEFRPDYRVCKDCKSAYCKKSTPEITPCPVYLGAVSVRSNLYCFICGHCLLLCPHSSPKVYLRHPLKEVIANKGKGSTCSYIVPFLIGSQISRFLVETPHWTPYLENLYLNNLVAFTLIFLFLSLALIFISRLTILFLGIFQDPIFGRFNLSIACLIPLAFTGELIYRLKYFMTELDNFILSVSNFLRFEPLRALDFKVPALFILGTSYFLLILALAGTVFTLYYFYAREFEREIPPHRYTGILLFALALFYIYLRVIGLSIER